MDSSSPGIWTADRIPTRVSLIIFRAGTEPPGDPDSYIKKIIRERYGKPGPQVEVWRLVGWRTKPSLADVLIPYAELSRSGQLPDLGAPNDDFEGDGPDGKRVVVLFFWHAMSSKAQLATDFLDRLRAGFSRFASQKHVYVAPNIPEKKLANARAAALVPEFEEVIAVIDCTTFGSAKNSLTFGKYGIYYHNVGVTKSWSYLTLAQHELTFKGSTLKFGDETKVSFLGTSAPIEAILNMVKAEIKI